MNARSMQTIASKTTKPKGEAINRVEKDGGVLQMQRTYSKKELYIKNNAFKLKVAN